MTTNPDQRQVREMIVASILHECAEECFTWHRCVALARDILDALHHEGLIP